MFHKLKILQSLLIFSISFILTYISIPILKKIAFKYKIVDKPDGVLKVHSKTTPYLGGLAIFINLLFFYLIFFELYNLDYLYIIISFSSLILLGLFDDIYKIKPSTKLIGQFLSIFILSFSTFYYQNIFINKTLTILINFFWTLSIINAFNLVDVMDGLCATLATVSTISFVVIAFIFNQYDILILLLVLLGSLLGFLRYNLPPATIYLGDSGSMFLGGFLGTIPFLLKWQTNTQGIVSTFSILFIVIIELVFLILIRTYKKIPFYLGSPHHFKHYLQKKKWNTKKILLFVCCVSLIIQLLFIAYLLCYLNIFIFIAFMLAILTLWFFIILT